ncbi:MAG: CDP-alcohol phosphatidyltransferase family protein [Candidatus Micrarchaeia archaeon]
MGMKNIGAMKKMQAGIGRALAALPFTPTQVTVFSVAVAMAAAWLAWQGQIMASAMVFLVSGALDAIDGAIARAKNMASARGAYIDGISDRLVEFLLVVSLYLAAVPAIYEWAPTWLLLLAILFFGSTMSSFATAYAVHRKAATQEKVDSEPGIMPRTERVILMCIALFAAAVNPALSYWLLVAIALLALVTFSQRFLHYAVG